MESVFCFEIAIDDLKLRKGISCDIPFVSIVFLKFPTIVIQLNKAVHQKANRYTFQKGKSCLFKSSPTELYKQLISTPVYLLVMEQGLLPDVKKQRKCIGTTGFDLDDTIKHIVQDIQNYGLHKTSSRGENLTLAVCNIMQDTIGNIEIAYKLTCLGHAMLPHLPTAPVEALPVTEKRIDFEIPSVADNVQIDDECCARPPALYYCANKSKQPKSVIPRMEISFSEVDAEKEDKENQVHLEKDRKSIVKEWRNKMQAFIQVDSTSGHKSESTQTTLQHLNQFPILQGLIQEVVELGLNQPSTESRQKNVAKVTTKHKSYTFKKRPLSSSVVKPSISPIKQRPHSSFAQKKSPPKSKKKYPLSYGLTKSHLLRLSTNKQTYFSQTYTKPTTPSRSFTSKKTKRSKPIKRSEKKRTISHRLVSTYTQTRVDDSGIKHYDDSLSEDGVTDNESIELPFALNVKEIDDLSLSPDKSSPRVLSRQSIEIRLPSALTEDLPEDEVDDQSSKYKYSDDFDDDHSSSYHAGSALTTGNSSPQPTTSYDTTTRDDTERASPNRLFADLSPQPTVSELSPAVSFRLTPRDSIPEEPEKEYLESVVSTVEDDLPQGIDETAPPSLLDLPSSPEMMLRSTKDFSPKYESHDEDSKPTDDSASIATAVMATKLPKPAPSSDSPVIRSLVSEPGSRKPRPPTISHSSSMEKIHRKFRKSAESSFQISDLSDVRTSDLADIRTSDLSDLKSTADSISPIHSTEVLGSNTSLPTLLKKKK